MAQGQTTHRTNLPPRRGPGRPPKYTYSSEPQREHTIHSNGTYSNDKSEKWSDKLKKNTTLVFTQTYPKSSGTVHKMVADGVYCRPRRDEEVDISRCTFYRWDELDSLGAEIV